MNGQFPQNENLKKTGLGNNGEVSKKFLKLLGNMNDKTTSK